MGYSFAGILLEALDRVKDEVENSLEDTIKQIQSEVIPKKEMIGYATFVEKLSILPLPLRKVYLYLLESNSASLSQISKEFDLDEVSTSKFVNQLIQSGFVLCRPAKKDQDSQYYIPRRENIPRMRQDFYWKNFLGPEMPAIYQFNLLCDDSRINSFRRVIRSNVNEGDVVIDLGTGTGILALFAAERAKIVYAVEANGALLKAAKEIASSYPHSGKITFIKGDACKFQPKEKADVIICEMVDTALIREAQVPVMDYAVENLLKDSGKVIPHSCETFVELVKVDYSIDNYTFRLPFYEKCGAKRVQRVMSKETLLHSIRFDEINPCWVEKEISLTVTQSGLVNGVRIKTYTYGDEKTKIPPSEWFNPPLVLPLSYDENGKPLTVKTRQKLSLYFSYQLGSSLDCIHYGII